MCSISASYLERASCLAPFGYCGFVGTQKDLEWRSGDVFRWVADKKLTLRIEHAYKLADATQAHRDLQGRKTTGKLMLLV